MRHLLLYSSYLYKFITFRKVSQQQQQEEEQQQQLLNL